MRLLLVGFLVEFVYGSVMHDDNSFLLNNLNNFTISLNLLTLMSYMMFFKKDRKNKPK